LKLEVKEPEDALTINLNKVALKDDYDFARAIFYRPSHANAPKWLSFINEGAVSKISERDAPGMIQYYWSAIVGTERSVGFAALMRHEGFGRFEEAIDEFRLLFNDEFLRSP
jgi:hypothetical protein